MANKRDTAAEPTALKDVMIRMRDGVALATDVYLPSPPEGSGQAKWPTLLTRTPYGKDAPGAPALPEGYGPNPGPAHIGQYFAARGYAVVVQDVRGRYKSEGTWGWLHGDADDGVDTCVWIGQQAWSNGDVGMFGTSYLGGTQHVVALAGAPELKTVIPVDAVSNMGRRGMRYGGAFELRFWNFVMTGLLDAWRGAHTTARRELVAMSRDRRRYLLELPLSLGATPLKLAPEYEAWLVEAMSHGADDAFWGAANVAEKSTRYQDMPVYLVGGWYDSWGGNTTENFVALRDAIRGPVYLIMGPWVHGQQANHAHGQVSFGPDAAIGDQFAWRLEWFDHWLKGIDNSVGKLAPFASPVRIFVMGTGNGSRDAEGRLSHGGYWRDEQEWPLQRTQYTNYYLHAGGLLSERAPEGAPSATTFDFDPQNPVPTIGGNISVGDGILQQGAWDQRGGEQIWNWQDDIPLSERPDVLVFESEPLAEDLEVTGELEVHLLASSSALDTDFTAKLIDVYPASDDWPHGFELNIADGIVRGRFQESPQHERLLEPGAVYEFTIRPYPTSNVFRRGHRIRLDISSSNFPRFDVNPNTGEPLNQHTHVAVARNTVFHEAGRASRLVLPVVPHSG